jgi:hypothetical protein
MTDTRVRGERLRSALLRRYPGLVIEVHFNDHVADGHGTYRGWCLSFESIDPNLLIKYKRVQPRRFRIER